MPIELYGLKEKLLCSKQTENEKKLSLCNFRDFRAQMQEFIFDNYDDVCRPGQYHDGFTYVSRQTNEVDLDLKKVEL